MEDFKEAATSKVEKEFVKIPKVAEFSSDNISTKINIILPKIHINEKQNLIFIKNT